MQEKFIPDWSLGNGRIDEGLFCQEFLLMKNLIYYQGSFFNLDGRIRDEMCLRKEIYDWVSPFLTCSPARKVESILQTLKLAAHRETMPCEENVVHTANGYYHFKEGKFYPKRVHCLHRLPVDYNPDAPEPERWLKFLGELLYEEDLETFQQFMGYCLLPVTYGQKMMIITGRGGEGKSRIGVVMKALLGENMNQGSLAKVETSPFARADLEHALLMVDDDLRLEALSSTNNIKAIVTAENPMDLERKGVQSYQGRLTCRFMAFGNGTLQALHDRSHGFFRRQILLEARERPRERKDDPLLAAALLREREGILLWAIEGLERLTENDYAFTMSRRARDNLLRSMEQSNSAFDFMNSRGYIRFAQEESISFRQLYEIYLDWCTDNGTRGLSRQSFAQYLNQNQQSLGITYSRTVPLSPGRRVRGYQGIAPA